ncbi:choice-of-anchor A family protein [Isosphaeraceae bacterium EP7]
MTRRIFGRIAGAMLTLAAPGLASADSVLYKYNVVTTGDFTQNSHVDYNTFIGGNLKGSGGVFSMSNNFPVGPGLTIAGTAVGSSNQQVNSNRNLVVSSAGAAGTVHLNGGSLVIDSTLATQAAQISQELQNDSIAFKALATNQAGPVVANNGQFTFTVNAATAVNGVAVFNINGALLSSNSVQNGLSLAGDFASVSSIIINVTGTSITTNGNFNGAWNGAPISAKTLWNFADATTLTLNNNFQGAILAVNAAVTHSSVSTDGSLFAKSLVSNGEIHKSLYSGYVPSPSVVPEPASLVMAGIGAAFAMVTARRRARA